MNKQDLIALAERVEKAEGPDRGLDCLIAVEVDWRPDEWEPGDRTVREMAERNGIEWVFARSQSGFVPRLLPRYTASLDAAMTLVLEGCGYEVASAYSDERDPSRHFYRLSGRFNARVYLAAGGSFEVNAATPPLALTAASLRAIAEERGDG